MGGDWLSGLTHWAPKLPLSIKISGSLVGTWKSPSFWGREPTNQTSGPGNRTALDPILVKSPWAAITPPKHGFPLAN